MDGAYVIWEDFLKLTIVEQKNDNLKSLAPILIKGLLEGISRPSEGRAEQDAEKESLYLWVKHVLEPVPLKPFFFGLERQVLRKHVLMWCCMHPGYWSQRLGKDMLKGQYEQNEEMGFDYGWQEIFEASLIGGAGNVATALGPPSPGFFKDISWDRFGSESFRKCPALDSDDDAELGNWVQKAIAPSTPIGVVR